MPGLLAVGDTPPPSVDARSVVVQAGRSSISSLGTSRPIVVSAQWNIAIRNFGKPPFIISLGGQFFQNQFRSPSGGWTGQGFVQMGPSELFKRGSFDLLNPFVQLFLQRNDGRPFSAGFSVGNQANWNIIQNQLSVFLNIQTAFGVGLNNGQGIPPPIQTYGVQIDIFKILFH